MDEPTRVSTPAHAPEAARLGNPSYVWRFGQERRLALIERFAPLDGRRVLDLGCGLGEYVRAAERHGARALGSDIAVDRLREARRRGLATDPPSTAAYFAAAGETLPVRDGTLDVIVLNEVIEHVADDRATVREIARALAPGGACILYAPNRLYPFETHGIYVRQRYVFGNIPFVNWLPDALRNRLVPHARAYRHGDWQRLIRGTSLRDRGAQLRLPRLRQRDRARAPARRLAATRLLLGGGQRAPSLRSQSLRRAAPRRRGTAHDDRTASGAPPSPYPRDRARLRQSARRQPSLPDAAHPAAAGSSHCWCSASLWPAAAACTRSTATTRSPPAWSRRNS